ncbi:MAG: hypothetical protein M1839_004795 [Geoglossum umbratile]|nr:MAG: hypothetical protein M1839_004795 [Geoglossum umbratile]
MSSTVNDGPKGLAPYHAMINDRLEEMPGLTILDQLMQQKSKKGFFHIQILHVLESGELFPPPETREYCSTPEEFHHTFSGAPFNRIGSFILVDNISAEVVETLGSRFNLRPEFFAIYLRETQNYREGRFRPSKHCELEILPSYYREAPFYSLELCRPYPFPGGMDEIAEMRKSGSAARGFYLMQGLDGVSARERVLVYETKTSDDKYVGIVLFDRLVKTGTPQNNIDTLTAFSHEPSNDGSRPPRRKEQVSCGEEIVWWLQRLDAAKRKTLFNNPNEPLCLRPLLQVSATTYPWYINESCIQLNHVALSQHDNSTPNCPEVCPNDVARDVHTGLYFHLKHLEKNVAIVKAIMPHLNHDSVLENALLGDIYQLRDEMRALLRRAENEIKHLGSKQAIEQTRTSVLQARQFNLLAKISTVFVPVSITAAVLAIPGPWYRLVIWAGTAGIIVAITIFYVVVVTGRQSRPESSSLMGFGRPRQRRETGEGSV